MKTCTEPGCSKPHLARGYCSTHYGKIIRGGNYKNKVKIYAAKNGHKKVSNYWKPKFLLLDVLNQTIHRLPKYVERTLIDLTQKDKS